MSSPPEAAMLVNTLILIDPWFCMIEESLDLKTKALYGIIKDFQDIFTRLKFYSFIL